eukprot:CAMPEP_0116542222 /NCGR_PEP_ID=MMETSP0397-20121206/901_1 /TAXON_ID=216820 /ORGANISM="Cyclophora tenuis, Strain ECT3854" /LENGTH=106 /DNA_ID=CAMNT_0004066217 /DNA_START=209 /DNA_END=526 /DNA_ORIENTATION=-
MTTFDLESNKLTGKIPTEIGFLTRLSILDLTHNMLTGNLPTEMGRLTRLQALFVANNSLSGVIPTEICTLWNSSLIIFFRDYGESNSGESNSSSYGGLSCPDVECG